MHHIRSFRGRIFLALLAVAFIPAVIALWAGTLALREVVTSAGTAGPWDAVAESGRVLLESVQEEAERNPAVAEAAGDHRIALSESVRLSRLYAYVAGRVLDLLPIIALVLAALIGGISLLAARHLSRQFSRPVAELVGWTRRIATDAPLPPVGSGASPITEVRVLQEALRSMETELREGRARDVESARLRSWTEMARRVSHELKNPLGPMRMAALTLTRDARERSVAEAGEVLLEEIARLDEMARSFAHFGRMPEGPTSNIDLKELMETLVRSHGSGGVNIVLDAPSGLPLVHGHYDAVLRVFRNLLLNAVEAADAAAVNTDTSGQVDVVLQGVANGIEILVRDSGAGIPPELLEDIWVPDFTTKQRGSGLGLPLVRRTIEGYGGRVTAENTPAGGALFRIFFPLASLERSELSA